MNRARQSDVPIAAEPTDLIREIRGGLDAALGPLLELYRNYLRLLARAQIGRGLRGKVDPSDLVQETFLEAQVDFSQFRGSDERQFVQWLRRILAGKIANLVRHFYGTQQRDVRLEREIEAGVEDSAHVGNELAASLASPSQEASMREYAVIVADALARLPEHYREVLTLRHFERLTFPEIATAMGRTEDSVGKLWLRALDQLRQSLRRHAP